MPLTGHEVAGALCVAAVPASAAADAASREWSRGLTPASEADEIVVRPRLLRVPYCSVPYCSLHSDPGGVSASGRYDAETVALQSSEYVGSDGFSDGAP